MNPPRICLLVIGDGRDDLLSQTLASFREMARDYELRDTVTIDDREHHWGFCGALRMGMETALHGVEAYDYIFHLEEDWRFLRPFSLMRMAALLEADSTLAQVSLLRGPHGAEGPAGPLGFPEPDVQPMSHMQPDGVIVDYLQQHLYYTTNPNLIQRHRADFIQAVIGATPARCEAGVTDEFRKAGFSFAVMGDGTPWVEHTGTVRTGTGY